MKVDCPECFRRTVMTREGFCQKCSPMVRAVRKQEAILRAQAVALLPEIEVWHRQRAEEEAELWAIQAQTER
jgi:hypothetical protein